MNSTRGDDPEFVFPDPVVRPRFGSADRLADDDQEVKGYASSRADVLERLIGKRRKAVIRRGIDERQRQSTGADAGRDAV